MSGNPLVGIIMDSEADWSTMQKSVEILDELGIANEAHVIPAHQTPARLEEYVSTARERGVKVIIAGAGKAAELPGAAAALTSLPVLGVPMKTADLGGRDSLLAIVQMPAGNPVGTLAIGTAGAINAGLFAAAILALGDNTIAGALEDWRDRLTASVPDMPQA